MSIFLVICDPKKAEQHMDRPSALGAVEPTFRIAFAAAVQQTRTYMTDHRHTLEGRVNIPLKMADTEDSMTGW